MHDSLKKICKGLEKEFESYAQDMSNDRLKMGEKDAERLKNLAVAMAGMKLLKMLEGMKEDGEQQNGHGVGQFMDQIKKQGMGGMMNAIGMPSIPGFNPSIGAEYPYIESPESRRGVPGTGRRSEYDEYDNWDDETEMRRGVPGSGRRRRRTRSEYDEVMNMNYNDGRSSGGQGGNSGGQGGSTGNTGGGGGR